MILINILLIFLAVILSLLLAWALRELGQLRSDVYSFRENVKLKILKDGTTDEALYSHVIAESRKLLPTSHKANSTHHTKRERIQIRSANGE